MPRRTFVSTPARIGEHREIEGVSYRRFSEVDTQPCSEMALTAGTPNLSTLPSLALSTSRPEAALPPATVFAIGYENPNSFIAAFRIAFGCTPGRYFD